MNESRSNLAAAAADAESDRTPIRRRKLGQEVLERLLSKIQSGSFPPGSQLPSERELMLLYAVGRPAVREALQGLERMGFLSIVHGERAKVLPLSAQSVIARMSDIAVHLLASSDELLDQFKQARLQFFVGIAQFAALRATPADIESLHASLQMQLSEDKHAKQSLQTEEQFFCALTAVTGNTIYAAVAQGMMDWMANFFVGATGAPQAGTFAEQRKKIVDCVAARDSVGAANSTREYFLYSNDFFRRPA